MIAREFINLVWDNFQIQTIVRHTAGKIPNQTLITKSILKPEKEISTIFPKSSLSTFIKATPHIAQLLNKQVRKGKNKP